MRVRDLLGTIIDARFRLVSVLGRGGTGATYLARHLALGHDLALKILRPELARDPAARARFHEEAAIASRVAHPNIVRVIDAGTFEGWAWIAMEFVPGRTLGRLVASEGRLDPRRAGQIAMEILDALAALHDAGVVHGDVKCENVIVRRSRNGLEVPKLLDFGIARRIADQAAPEGAPVRGTPHYIAPEVIQGAPPAPASDLYAAGVILYELLTGGPPFGGRNSRETLLHQLRDDALPPSLRAPGSPISPGLDRVVLQALAREPGLRWTSAAEMAAALGRVIRELPASVPIQAPDAPDAPRATPEDDTDNWQGDAAATSPASDLRRRIGQAIRRGDRARVAQLYASLAVELCRLGERERAAQELREGIDLVTVPGVARDDGLRRLHALLAACASGARPCRDANRAS